MKTYSSKATAKRALKNALAKIDLALEDVAYDILPADAVDKGDGFVNRVEFVWGEVPDGVEALEETAIVVYPETTPKKSKSGYIRGGSTVDGPCGLVHMIADRMIAENPEATRKEIMAACMREGVTYGTARTQYQKWKNKG